MEYKTERVYVENPSETSVHDGQEGFVEGSLTHNSYYEEKYERRVVTSDNRGYSYGSWRKVNGSSSYTWTTRWTRNYLDPRDCTDPLGAFVKSWNWNGSYLTIVC